MEYFTPNTQLPPYLPYPRFLLDIPVSETVKIVYILILGRSLLSKVNGWVDSDGRIYCRYPIQQLARDAHRGKTTIVAALSDLEKQDLIHRCRSGSGYANKLYLRLPESSTADDRKTAPQRTGKPAPIKKNRNIKLDYEYMGDSL